jgi:hypothetical protein
MFFFRSFANNPGLLSRCFFLVILFFLAARFAAFFAAYTASFVLPDFFLFLFLLLFLLTRFFPSLLLFFTFPLYYAAISVTT